MLFEKIPYKDDFPINITIASIDDYPIHYHQDIEFVFILKGEIKLKNGYCNYVLHKGDIFTNSGHEVHSLTSTGQENVVALIQISTHYFSQYFPSLSKACYRTYTNKTKTKKHDTLQEKLLNILLQYSIKSSKYKNECIYAMVDVIKYLEKVFNSFAFNGNMVVNFESGNQVTIERISHIIGYIYQYYAEKITLDDLAKMEHLSTFYLSHIIKNCTGMNFREFLCFARVEWSEIQLLDTNKKISQIARDVGFSTTAYYEKYFLKWFGRTPQEHRELFMPLVKSELHQETLSLIPPNKAITLIRNSLSAFTSRKNSTSLVNSLKLEIEVDITMPPISQVFHRLNVLITPNDFQYLGFNIFHHLSLLRPKTVTIMFSSADDPESVSKLHSLLETAGFQVEQKNKRAFSNYVVSAGNDSIALPIYLVHKWVRSNEEWITLSLRDDNQSDEILMGLPSVLTAQGIEKPSYFIYQMLPQLNGNLLCWGKQYCIIQTGEENAPEYIIVVSNFNDDIYNMPTRETSLHQAKTVFNEFKDEIDFNVTLNLAPGMYSVAKYSLSRNHNIFSYLASFDFSDQHHFAETTKLLIPTEPELEVSVEDVRTSFNITFCIRGAGLQLAIIRLKGDSKDVR